jgi:hypothetical protein
MRSAGPLSGSRTARLRPAWIAAVALGLALAAHSQATPGVGYVVLTADAGRRLPVGAALFGTSNAAGVLVSQAGVGASRPARAGRIFVGEGETRTGVALVNSSAQPASVTLVLRDASGRGVGRATQTLAAGQHLARYVSELFPAAAPAPTGSLGFESDQALAAVALREGRNARGEPLYSTLPVIDPDAAPEAGPAVLPQIAAGDGYATQILLVNPTGQRLSGELALTGSDGNPLELRVAGATTSRVAYVLDPNGAARVELDRPAGLAVGYAALRPDPGSPPPAGAALFRFQPGGTLVTEAGVAATPATTSARIFVDQAGGSTGLALANPSNEAAHLTFTLLDRYGGTAATVTRTLPARAHVALFVPQLFPDLGASYTGLLDVGSTTPIHAITLLQTENALARESARSMRQPASSRLSPTSPRSAAGRSRPTSSSSPTASPSTPPATSSWPTPATTP